MYGDWILQAPRDHDLLDTVGIPNQTEHGQLHLLLKLDDQHQEAVTSLEEIREGESSTIMTPTDLPYRLQIL